MATCVCNWSVHESAVRIIQAESRIDSDRFGSLLEWFIEKWLIRLVSQFWF